MSQITWRSIATPNFIDPTRGNEAYQNSLKGLGNFLGSQIDIQSKLAEETKAKANAETMYNFKNALAGAMDSPEAIQAGITSGTYGQLASQMGVDPEQARGFLDINKLVPEARTRQTQNEAYDEARQLREVLPMLQQMENTVRSGTSAAELERGFQELISQGAMTTDMVNKLRKASFVADDQRLAQLDAANKRTDADALRARNLTGQAEADKLKADTKTAASILNSFNATKPIDVNDSQNYQALNAKLVEAGLPVPVINDTLVKFKEAVNVANPTERMGNQALAAKAAQEVLEANQRKVASLEAGEQAVKQYKTGTLAQLGTPNGAYGEPEGSKAVAETMEAIGIGPTAKDDFADRRGHVIKVLDKYTNKGIPADVISMFLKETPAEDPLFGIELTDKALSVGLDARLKAWLSKQENLDTIQKMKTINEEANRRRAALYEGRSTAAASQLAR
jgi:hypothetical protein